jgi:hypothetical protein
MWKNFPLYIFKILCIFRHFLAKKRERKMPSAIKKCYVFGHSEQNKPGKLRFKVSENTCRFLTNPSMFTHMCRHMFTPMFTCIQT